MHPRTLIPIFIASAFALATPVKAQIAITELLTNPDGGDDEIREFFELFNFSLEPVDIAGWEVVNDDNQFLILSDSELIIPSGGYLVFSADKALLETERFDGVPQDRIIGYDASEEGFEFSNSSAEITLFDELGMIVWSLAYDNDDNGGEATFLTVDDFSIRIWGSKDAPGINREGEDPASGTLGYETNGNTEDPLATEAESEDVASPLLGFYTPIDTSVLTTDISIRSIVPGSDAGTFDITFNSQAGFSYTIESSNNLGTFAPEFVEEGTGALMTVTVTPEDAATQFFYRVRQESVE